MFIPLVLTVARKTGLNSKRMLMPLSVAALISGMMTLIASSPNMIIESALRGRGLACSISSAGPRSALRCWP
jgi:di/tricarboxylate transporter